LYAPVGTYWTVGVLGTTTSGGGAANAMEGGVNTTAFPFFAKVTDFKMAFRKRILHKGSTIGYHVQDFDEVYYILSGSGEYTLNGVKRQVGPGTAMLTRPGDSHGLRPTGDGEMALIIAYPTPSR